MKNVRVKKNENTQVKNPATGNYLTRESSTGKFVVKADGTPFNGIKVRRSTIRSSYRVKLIIAKKAERAVIEVRNSMTQ